MWSSPLEESWLWGGSTVHQGDDQNDRREDLTMWKWIGLLFVLCSGCMTNGDTVPDWVHKPLFSIPFARGDLLTVHATEDDAIELHSARPLQVVAPQHVTLEDVSDTHLLLQHAHLPVFMEVQQLEEVWGVAGTARCAQDTMGRTRYASIRVYGEQEETADLGLGAVRVVRNHMLTDLLDLRVTDQVHSALASEGWERKTDVDNAPCPFNTGEME